MPSNADQNSGITNSSRRQLRALKEVQAGIEQLAARGVVRSEEIYRRTVIRPLMDALDGANSFGELLEATHSLARSMDLQPLADALAETTTVAALIGRVSATPVATKKDAKDVTTEQNSQAATGTGCRCRSLPILTA